MKVGIVLASGLSSRFHSAKQLHVIHHSNYGPQPMALLCALKLKSVVDLVICVARREHEDFIQQCGHHGIMVCQNDRPQLGLSHSIHLALAYLQQQAIEANSLWLALGDMPYIKQKSYETILHTSQCHPDKIIRPQYCPQRGSESQNGHPIVFPAQYLFALKHAQGDKGAGPWLKQHAHHAFQLPLTDQGIIHDVDHQDDVLTL